MTETAPKKVHLQGKATLRNGIFYQNRIRLCPFPARKGQGSSKKRSMTAPNASAMRKKPRSFG